MDTNTIVAWLVGAHCVFGLVRILRSPLAHMHGWIVVFGGLSAAIIALWRFAPEHLAAAVLPPFVFFALLPQIAFARGARALAVGDFRAAFRWYAVARFTHPFRNAYGWPTFVARVRMDQEHLDDAEASLAAAHAIATKRCGARGAALAHIAYSTGDWEAWLDRFEQHPERRELERDPSLYLARLTALGELSRIDELVALYEANESRFAGSLPPTTALLVRATVAAYLGDVGTVAWFERGAVMEMDDRLCFLRGRALERAGRAEEGREVLLALTAYPNATKLQRRRAARALERPLAPLPISDALRLRLGHLHERERHDARFALVPRDPRRAPWATRALVVLLGAVFALQLARGATLADALDADGNFDPTELIAMGVLVTPPDAPYDQWWRPFSAAFLHVDGWHFALNALGLVFLGGLLERGWSRRWMLGVYLAAVVVSSQTVALIGSDSPQIFLGASGGVMGLLGAALGRTLVARALGCGSIVPRQALTFGAIVALQMVFDWSMPMVSSTAHLVGLATGFAIGAGATFAQRRR
jgi:membrane associated rhomboid family serine protease